MLYFSLFVVLRILGTVTLWSPNINTPLVKMLCHRGPLTAVAVDNSGRYMVTAAMDARLKIWDIRTYKELHSNFTQVPCSCVDVSQRGLVCVGKRTVVEVWRDVFSERQTRPYLTHRLKGEVSDVQFCPFEDCLGIGHSRGFTSIIVPGAMSGEVCRVDVCNCWVSLSYSPGGKYRKGPAGLTTCEGSCAYCII